ncbi:PREDICTED: GDSL esterase/lipase At2g42990-like [Lupinus angustifolius]|uniref:GDSL esterase/lipase At2g42990-like n=1 Tax=Lupinus angustifolius TaxID=3871 RepID=UPI00092EA54A|nr:PREDICTED: GDSL esterase/lipase At2g42990-like [Lupinus angustifolius]
MYNLWLFLIEIILHFSISSSGKVTSIIVFGDSSVDTGNNNFIPTMARSNFKPYGRDFFDGNPTGRFSNGRIPPDFISEAFGLKQIVPAYLDPTYNISDFASGVCFASAGTGFDNATSNVADVIPLWKEVEYYKEYQIKLRAHVGVEKANEILREALYLVSIGTNDFLENYYTLPQRRCQFNSVEEYEDFLIVLAENFFREIYELGARKVSVTALPPMGCLPLERAINVLDYHGCVEGYNDVALEFNGKVGRLVTKLNNELYGFQLVDANAYHILLQIVTQPSSFGFEDSRLGCCGTGRFEMGFFCDPKSPFTCKDANKYVFWDAFHPSEKTSQIVSNYLIENYLAKFL